MKKLFFALMITVLFGRILQADMLRIEAGGGVWNNEVSGTMKYKAFSTVDVNQLGFDKETGGYIWVYIKHPIPIIPNIRLEYLSLAYDGTSTSTFYLGEEPFGVNTNSNMDVKQYDAILYYNILDNTMWTTLDLGLDIKYFDYNYHVNGRIEKWNKTVTVTDSLETIMPLLYGRVRFEIPATGVGIEGMQDIRNIEILQCRILV